MSRITIGLALLVALPTSRLLAQAKPAAKAKASSRAVQKLVTAKKAEGIADVRRLVTTYERTGHLKKAVAACEQGVKAFPGDDSLVNELIRVAELARDYGAALAGHRALVAKSPGDSNRHIKLGTCYFRLGKEEEAKRCWEEAGGLAPKSESFYNTLGRTYKSHGLMHEAAAVFGNGCKAFPKSYNLHYALAQALEALRDYKGSIEAYEKAYALSSNAGRRRSIEWRLIEVYKMAGRYEELIERREQDVARHQQEILKLRMDLGKALEAEGKKAEAIGVYEGVLSLAMASPLKAEAQRRLRALKSPPPPPKPAPKAPPAKSPAKAARPGGK